MVNSDSSSGDEMKQLNRERLKVLLENGSAIASMARDIAMTMNGTNNGSEEIWDLNQLSM